MKFFKRNTSSNEDHTNCVNELQAGLKTFYNSSYGYVPQNHPVRLDRCYD
ncbi:hypothetical protein [Candidatus Lokiarchaeum ossiferum]